MNTKPIKSFDSLRRRLPVFFQSSNSDPDLARAAAANPILALEEQGFKFDPEFRRTVDRRIRFQGERLDRLNALAAQIHEASSRVFDVNDPKELEKVLFSELKIAPPSQAEPDGGVCQTPKDTEQKEPRPRAAPYPMTAPLRPAVFGHAEQDDPLEAIRGAHPIVEPLLEYRRLDASEPRLAPRDLYDRIRSGEQRLPMKLTKLRVDHKHPPDER